MVSKAKIRSMQRGARNRADDKKITSAELYENSPPKLTDAEIGHFQIGNRDFDSFFENLYPILLACHKNGKGAAGDVAKILNRQRITTAIGAPWSPRLAWFLMKTWRSVHADRATSGSRGQIFINGKAERKASDIQVRATSRHNYEKIIRNHFKNPTFGEAFPELEALKAMLEGRVE